MSRIFDRHGITLHRSQNLRGLLEHARRYPDDLVVKITEREGGLYPISVYWPSRGDEGRAKFADWRVLLDWLAARRSWSINRITLDAPLYDRIEQEAAPRFKRLRDAGTLVTRHAYQKAAW